MKRISTVHYIRSLAAAPIPLGNGPLVVSEHVYVEYPPPSLFIQGQALMHILPTSCRTG
jgi:hypothetical protein